MPTRFDRVMFWMLVPGVALVAAVATAVPLVAPANSFVAIHLVFLYVLLGSTMLNAWLALRHPRTLTERALPRRLALDQAALYGVTLLWLLFVIVNLTEAVVALSFVLMGLAIFAFRGIRARGRDHQLVERLTLVPLTPRLLAVLLAVLLTSVATAVLYLWLGTERTEGYWTFPLMLLGVPWSHTWYLISTLVLAVTGGYPLITSALLVPLGANVVLIVVVISSPSSRARLVNRFLRLGVVTVGRDLRVYSPYDGDDYLASERTPEAR